jgi:uncharacterized membrane protein YozB (DUF420 family)
MEWVYLLPHVNAILNATSGALLVAGFVKIRKGRVAAHRAFMISAFTASTLFLISYITYHSLIAFYYHRGPTPFLGQGPIRAIYFTILISHTLLAVIVAPFIIVTLRWALQGDFLRHPRLARWTLPVWLYVSVTGVVVYVLLYHLYRFPQ